MKKKTKVLMGVLIGLAVIILIEGTFYTIYVLNEKKDNDTTLLLSEQGNETRNTYDRFYLIPNYQVKESKIGNPVGYIFGELLMAKGDNLVVDDGVNEYRVVVTDNTFFGVNEASESVPTEGNMITASLINDSGSKLNREVISKDRGNVLKKGNKVVVGIFSVRSDFEYVADSIILSDIPLIYRRIKLE